MTAPLVLDGLRAWHPGRDVWRGLTFDAAPGTILGVFGPNGSGKTTLVRALAGVHRDVAGQLEAPARRAIVPQGFRESFFAWATLRTNLVLTCPRGLAAWRDNAARVEATRRELGLELDLGLRPGACSDGMLQQAALIRALAPRPELLLCDEPFSALDVEVARTVRRRLRELVTRAGMVAVLVLHDLDSIVELCDRVLVLDGGPEPRLLENRWRAAAAEVAPVSFVELIQRVLASGDDG